MSRSLVGSSRISTLGALMRIFNRYSRRRSPPDSFWITVYCTDGGNKNRSSIWEALMLPSFVWTYSATFRI